MIKYTAEECFHLINQYRDGQIDISMVSYILGLCDDTKELIYLFKKNNGE